MTVIYGLPERRAAIERDRRVRAAVAAEIARRRQRPHLVLVKPAAADDGSPGHSGHTAAPLT